MGQNLKHRQLLKLDSASQEHWASFEVKEVEHHWLVAGIFSRPLLSLHQLHQSMILVNQCCCLLMVVADMVKLGSQDGDWLPNHQFFSQFGEIFIHQHINKVIPVRYWKKWLDNKKLWSLQHIMPHSGYLLFWLIKNEYNVVIFSIRSHSFSDYYF